MDALINAYSAALVRVEAAEEALVRVEAGHLHQPSLLQAKEGSPLRLAAAASLLGSLLLLLVVLFPAPPPDNQSRRCIPTSCKRTYKQSVHQCSTAGNPRIRWLLVLVIDLGLDGRGNLLVRAIMASKAGARQPVAEACTR
jgi:hypothetical protein